MTNSSTSLPPTTATAPPPSAAAAHALSSLGLGYAIAIALGFLVLLSTLLLSSYLCCRHPRHHPSAAASARASSGRILPRVFFVSEDDDDEENPNDSSSGVVGLHQSAINSYPKYSFSKSGASKDDSNSPICSICLSDYIDGEMLRMMPDCKHFFHLLCLDAWLRLNGSCPVCRSSPLPTPLSTPLAEVVPLAQFAEDRRRRS